MDTQLARETAQFVSAWETAPIGLGRTTSNRVKLSNKTWTTKWRQTTPYSSVEDKPFVQTCRDNFMARPSFAEANIGLTGEGGESMRGAGLKTLDTFQKVFESLAAGQEW